MKLNLSQIKSITTGAVRIEELSDGFHFYRFTAEQQEIYKNRNQDFYEKTFATSGVKMCFNTNSTKLFLKTTVTRGSSRSYFAFDVFVNGKLYDALDNYSHLNLPLDYTKEVYQGGEFSKEFTFGAGEKEICIYFPWSVAAVVKELSLDDGAVIESTKPTKKMVCYGDSITHGYDALHPSNKYITKFSESLNAAEYNKGIGGEVYFPGLASAKEDFLPDYITVAYGANDCYCKSQDAFLEDCKIFYENLDKSYKGVKTFVITPIWRKDHAKQSAFGEFKMMYTAIKNIVSKYPNITVIDGYNLVEHNEEFFGDLRLHPNDKGFVQYFENILKQLKA